jgi:hypothetical protein
MPMKQSGLMFAYVVRTLRFVLAIQASELSLRMRTTYGFTLSDG